MDETHQFKFYVFKLVHEYLVILKQKVVYVVNKNERATEYDVVGALVARAVGCILYTDKLLLSIGKTKGPRN